MESSSFNACQIHKVSLQNCIDNLMRGIYDRALQGYFTHEIFINDSCIDEVKYHLEKKNFKINIKEKSNMLYISW